MSLDQGLLFHLFPFALTMLGGAAVLMYLQPSGTALRPRRAAALAECEVRATAPGARRVRR